MRSGALPQAGIFIMFTSIPPIQTGPSHGTRKYGQPVSAPPCPGVSGLPRSDIYLLYNKVGSQRPAPLTESFIDRCRSRRSGLSVPVSPTRCLLSIG